MRQVGVNWPSTFVKCQPELKVKFNRKYDYKRALYKDPEIIRGVVQARREHKGEVGHPR
jgi:hypothetical protein